MSNSTPIRSWVDGDESDIHPGSYYCFSCNSFSGPKHFASESMAKALPSLYRQSTKLNRQRLITGGWHRPDVVSEVQIPWVVLERLTEKPPRRRRS